MGSGFTIGGLRPGSRFLGTRQDGVLAQKGVPEPEPMPRTHSAVHPSQCTRSPPLLGLEERSAAGPGPMGLWKPLDGCCLGGLQALKKGDEEMMTRGGLGYGQFSDRRAGGLSQVVGRSLWAPTWGTDTVKAVGWWGFRLGAGGQAAAEESTGPLELSIRPHPRSRALVKPLTAQPQ